MNLIIIFFQYVLLILRHVELNWFFCINTFKRLNDWENYRHHFLVDWKDYQTIFHIRALCHIRSSLTTASTTATPSLLAHLHIICPVYRSFRLPLPVLLFNTSLLSRHATGSSRPALAPGLPANIFQNSYHCFQDLLLPTTLLKFFRNTLLHDRLTLRYVTKSAAGSHGLTKPARGSQLSLRRREPFLLAKPTGQLMPTAQHGGTHMEHQHRKRDNQVLIIIMHSTDVVLTNIVWPCCLI